MADRFETFFRMSPAGAAHQTPRRIVVHAMAYQVDYEGERLLAATLLERLGLSAHALMAPDGTRIRCRRDDQGAYHARGFNENSLGIEVLVPDVYDYAGLLKRTAEPGWISRAQFDAVAEQLLEWKRLHSIVRIDRHSDLDPERRWFDPGAGFPWAELLQRTWGVN